MKITLLFSMIMLSGCALINEANQRSHGTWDQYNRQKAEERRRAEEEAEDGPYLQKFEGRSEDDVILEFGAPTQTSQVGSFKVFIMNEVHTVPSEKSISKSTADHHYAELRFYFKDGRVVKWDYKKRPEL